MHNIINCSPIRIITITCEHFSPKPLKTVVPQIETVEGVKTCKRALSDLKNMHNCKSLNFCQIEENYGTLFSLKMLESRPEDALVKLEKLVKLYRLWRLWRL